MQSVKKFFNTLAMFAGNLLRLTPISWGKAEEEAISLQRSADAVASMEIECNGKKMKVATPLTFFADACLNALAFVVGVWLIVQIINLFYALLVPLLVIAVVMWLISTYMPASVKGNVTVS